MINALASKSGISVSGWLANPATATASRPGMNQARACRKGGRRRDLGWVMNGSIEIVEDTDGNQVLTPGRTLEAINRPGGPAAHACNRDGWPPPAFSVAATADANPGRADG